MGYFCGKNVIFELKDTEEFVVKNDLWFDKNGINNLVNFLK